MSLWQRLKTALMGERSLQLAISMEVRRVELSELTEEERFQYRLDRLMESFGTIDHVVGGWIPNAIRDCEPVVGSRLPLGRTDRGALRQFVGVDVHTYGEAATLVRERLRVLEARGMALPADQRRRRNRK